MHKVNNQSLACLYERGLSSTKIAELFGISATTVLERLRKVGASIRNNSESKRKYKLNEYFFDNIDTEEKAYFLGFIFADGCNLETRHTITIALKTSDEDTLEKLNKLVYSERKLYYYTDRNGYKKCIIRIHSAHMSRILATYGCVQRKGSILCFPKIDPKLHSAFIRGYFDGDGGIAVRKRIGTDAFTISIVSTKQFLQQIGNIFKSKLGVSITISGPYSVDGKIFKLHVSGNQQVLRTLKYLYENASIFMYRKAKMIDNLQCQLNIAKNRQCKINGCKAKVRSIDLCWKHLIDERRKVNQKFFTKNDLDSKTIYELYVKGISQRQIARQFGVSPACICKRIKLYSTTYAKMSRLNSE